MPVLVIRLDPGEPRRIDGLCSSCLNPSLFEFDIYRIGDSGVSTVATWRGCSDCGPNVGVIG